MSFISAIHLYKLYSLCINVFFLYYRVTPESDIDDDLDGSVLSLGLFPGEYLDSSTALSGSGMADDRVFFRFEAAWDSSLHNSLLLNRVTPAGETIYMTISAYLEVSRSLGFHSQSTSGPFLVHFQSTFGSLPVHFRSKYYEMLFEILFRPMTIF